MTGRQLQHWVIQPKVDGEHVAAMEGVLSTYEEPYDEQRPVVRRDEQLVRYLVSHL